MIKTIALTANTETEVELTGGCHVSVENRGTGIIYASKAAGLTAGADGVIAIDSGTSKKMKNTAAYSEKNGIYDYHGKIYLLSDTDGTAEIETGNYFFDGNSGGGGYDDTELKNEIAGKVGKTDYPTSSMPGAVTIQNSYGIGCVNNSHDIFVNAATASEVSAGTNGYKPIVPKTIAGMFSNYGITSKTFISSLEKSTNKVTEITETSTDEQYPSAKAVFDLVGAGANNSKFAWGIVNFPDDSSTDGEYTTWHDSTPVTVTLDFKPSVVILISQFSLNNVMSSPANTAYSLYFQNKTYKNGEITNNGFNFKYDVITITTGPKPAAKHNYLSDYIKPEDDVIYIALGT